MTLRVVLDSNVLVSAAIQRGPSHRLVRTALLNAGFDLIICPMLIDEVEEVLTKRERLRRWIDLDSAREYVDLLKTFHSVAANPAFVVPTTRDLDDDYIVALAREQSADFIVSGDKDLLEWPEQSPPVVTPEAFERSVSGL